MGLISLREAKKLVHPHYILNLMLALSYIFLKTLNPFCELLFSSCELDYRETEILFFTVVIIVFRTRKQGAINMLPYVGTACMLAKLGNVILFFYSDPIYGVAFIVSCLLHLLLLPEPSYRGPEHVLYFRGIDLEEELKSNKQVIWLVEFYAAWNPTCIDFASTFSELSAKYNLQNLRFGKVDLARNPDSAEKYKINTSPLSKQLPTLILFKNGQEEDRRPLVASNGKLVAFSFTFENVVATFDLNNIYKTCQENPLKPKSKGKKDDHPKAD
jgi:thiol-disulfide isomerase/thioredoxin